MNAVTAVSYYGLALDVIALVRLTN